MPARVGPGRDPMRSTPATRTSSTSEAADDWLSLLEAFDQPHRAGVVRAAAATMFFGKTAQDLVAGR